jgi:hypothetical protein
MANLASKVDDIEEFFQEVVIKFVAKLGNNQLRKMLGQVIISLTNNPKFSRLSISSEVFIQLGNLFGTRRNLNIEDIDFNSITELLLNACNNFASLNKQTIEFLAANCVYWVRLDELSVRDKGLEFLSFYMADLEAEDKKCLLRYKQNILDTAVYYLRSHYGNEAQIKSAVRILDLNLTLGTRVSTEQFDLPYLDLEGLESTDKKKNVN